MRYDPILLSALLILPAAAAAQSCLGPQVPIATIGQRVNPPEHSGAIDELYHGTFKVARTGVYQIDGRVTLGMGAGAPVDFTHVKATVEGVNVIDEVPPSFDKMQNGWTYFWSISFYSIDKPYSVRRFLEQDKTYTYSVAAKGAYQVYHIYHRRDYSVHLSAVATYCGPAATKESFGTACGTAPALESPLAPVLGQRRDLVVRGRSNAGGVLALGLRAAQPTYLGAGCSLHLAAPLLLQPIATDGAGVAWALFAIPADASLAGLRIAAQAALANAQSPIGMDLTAGMEWTLGY